MSFSAELAGCEVVLQVGVTKPGFASANAVSAATLTGKGCKNRLSTATATGHAISGDFLTISSCAIDTGEGYYDRAVFRLPARPIHH